MFDMIGGALLKFARSVFDDVMGQIMQQSKICEEVSSRFSSLLQPVMNGAWTGQGANSFIEEVQTRLVPEIMALIASIGGFSANLNFSFDMLEQADNKASSLADGLGDIFNSIF